MADNDTTFGIEQDADVVMFVYREEYYLSKGAPEQRAEESQEHFNTRYDQWKTKLESAEGKAEIIIAKQRHGPTGVIKPNFIAEQTKFVDGISDERLPEGY